MPSSDDILSSLTFIANIFRGFAIIWHVFFFALIIALITRWKPSARLLTTLLILPFLSVSIFAWLANNYFNGSFFLVTSVILFMAAWQVKRRPVSTTLAWSTVGGSLLIIFGLIYPEFLHADSFVEFIYASPAGLIPCPTLAVIIGFTLVFLDYEFRLWITTVSVAGLFYGIFGVFKLHVPIDIFLLGGSLMLVLKLFVGKRHNSVIISN